MAIDIKNNVSWTPYLGDGTAESYIVGSSRVYRTLRVIEGRFTLDSTNFPCGASSLTYEANIYTYNEGFSQNSITAYAIIGTSQGQYKNTYYDALSDEDKNKCFQIVQDFKNETEQSTGEIEIEFNFEPNITYYIFLIPKNNDYGLLTFNECTKFEVEPITSFTLTIDPDGGEMIEYYNSSTNPSEITNTTTSFEVKFLYNNYRYLGNYVKNFYSLTNNTLGQPKNKIGYTFNGWEVTSGGGTVQRYDASSGIKGYTTDDFDELKIPQTFSYYLYDGKYAGDATVTAQWTANTYTVTFNADGGSVSPTTKSVTYNSTYGDLPTPTKTGYNFSGWHDSNGNKISSDSTVNIASNHTLIAQWTAKTYKIIFYENEGTLPEKLYENSSSSDSLTPVYGTDSYYSWEILAQASRNGYALTGYYDASSGGNQIYTDKGRCVNGKYWDSKNKWIYDGNDNETIKVYAQWEPINYTLTIDPNGGTYKIYENEKIIEKTNILEKTFPFVSRTYLPVSLASDVDPYIYDNIYGSCITQPKGKTAFIYWKVISGPTEINNKTIDRYTGDSGNEFYYIDNRSYEEYSDITVQAYYRNITSYTLKYIYNSLTSEEEKWETGDSDLIVDTLAMENKVIYQNGSTTSKTVYYTKDLKYWKNQDNPNQKIETGKTFDMNYLSQDGQTITLIFDETDSSLWSTYTLEKPEGRLGYTFEGWFTEEDGQGEKIGNGGDEVYLPNLTTTLYAYWKPSGGGNIKTPDGWKRAASYIYKKEANEEKGKWIKAIPYIYDASSGKWRQGL